MTVRPPDPRTPGLRSAVFLDRDGTMIHEVGYLSRVEDIRWFAGSLDAIRLLNRAGHVVCVITNQSGIALGLFDETVVRGIHAAMDRHLAAAGARVDGWYFCPHHPRATREQWRGPCDCRKPGRAMIDAACRDHGLDPARSWMVGDRDIDVQLAQVVGARGMLVRTGYGAAEAAKSEALPAGTRIVADLAEAAADILTWP